MFCRFPLMNRAKVMHHFSSEVGRDLRKPSDRINRTFGNRYKVTQIANDITSLQTVYKYIYANPIKAGIVENCLEYKYSTLPRKLGFFPLDINVVNDPFIQENNIQQHLNWINDVPCDDYWKRTAYQLNRHKFQMPKDRTTRENIIF